MKNFDQNCECFEFCKIRGNINRCDKAKKMMILNPYKFEANLEKSISDSQNKLCTNCEKISNNLQLEKKKLSNHEINSDKISYEMNTISVLIEKNKIKIDENYQLLQENNRKYSMDYINKSDNTLGKNKLFSNSSNLLLKKKKERIIKKKNQFTKLI